jgi:TnpA family transposase
MHLLGFRFAPRIRDLGDTKLFIPKGDTAYDALKPMISSDRLNIKQIAPIGMKSYGWPLRSSRAR